MHKELASPINENALIKDKIIEAAREIFARFGFKKTTMNEIAGSVFKAKSSIYYYYKSKEEIYKAIVEKEGNILKAALAKAINQEQDARLKLRSYVITRAQFIKHLSNFYVALKDEYLKNYSFIEKLREKDLAEEKAMISGLIQEGIQAGLFVVESIELSSLAIVTALKGFELSWALEKELDEIEKDTDVLLGILFNGLMKR